MQYMPESRRATIRGSELGLQELYSDRTLIIWFVSDRNDGSTVREIRVSGFDRYPHPAPEPVPRQYWPRIKYALHEMYKVDIESISGNLSTP